MSRPTDIKKAKFVIFWPRKGQTWQPWCHHSGEKLTIAIERRSVHTGGETFWELLPLGLFWGAAANKFRCKWQHSCACASAHPNALR